MHFLEAPEFWVAVAFVLFVVLAGKPIYRAVAAQLDARAARIKAELEEAAIDEPAERTLRVVIEEVLEALAAGPGVGEADCGLVCRSVRSGDRSAAVVAPGPSSVRRAQSSASTGSFSATTPSTANSLGASGISHPSATRGGT